MKYIQLKGRHGLETIDEFETRKEAVAMVREYRIADPSGEYYISSRACREWREKDEPRHQSD